MQYGEIIGFSKSIDMLFNAWMNSKAHKSVINDSRWNLIGVGIEKKGEVFVSVITFSSGIINAINYLEVEDGIIVTGSYSQEPIFKSGNKIINYNINKEDSTFYIKTVNNKIIQVYNTNNKLTDRIELFF